MSVAILGAGAFGTALALTLARKGQPVSLHARTARSRPALPGVSLLPEITLTTAAPTASTVLLAVPTQALSAALRGHDWAGRALVACCKGVETTTGHLPHEIIAAAAPGATPALLSGPSFAVDIANGLPTALTLAAPTEPAAKALQHALSTNTLRLYRSTDMAGVALGGALKNVIAIACGMAMGAGLGESARAALVTRGFAEINRLAQAMGAEAETLAGLSGLGDLALTCTSEKSRNYGFGLRLGAAGHAETIATTEGIATARAALSLAEHHGVDVPIVAAVAAVLANDMSVEQAKEALLTRPLRRE